VVIGDVVIYLTIRSRDLTIYSRRHHLMNRSADGKMQPDHQIMRSPDRQIPCNPIPPNP